MPFVQADPYALYDDKLSRPQPQPEQPDYSVGEVFGAAFARENSLGSLYERVFGDGAEGRFYWHPDKVGDDRKRNIDYDAWGQIQGTPYEGSYPEFFWVSNDAEFAQVKARLDREFKRDQILSESGVLGDVAGITMGVLI